MIDTKEKELPAIAEQGLVPVIDIEQAKNQLKQLQDLVRHYLDVNVDYGKLPGTGKDALFKSGAEKLNEIYGFYPQVKIISKEVDWKAEPPLFDYEIETTLIRRSDGAIMGMGLGCCSTYESNYKYRQLERSCPNCNKPAIMPSKAEWGGGFYCNPKKGGCGNGWKEFATDRHKPDVAEMAVVKMIKAQDIGRTINENVVDLKNTVLKMAKKRSLVDAVISATRSSGIFTQDIEDFIKVDIVQENQPPKEVPAEDVVDVSTGEVKDAQEAPLSTQEFAAFMNMYQEKGFTRAQLLEIITTNCKPEGVTMANINKKFTHKLMARCVEILNKTSVVDSEENQ